MNRAMVIVNPASGRTASRLEDLHALFRTYLEDAEIVATTAADHATKLTSDALRQGTDLVVAVGGDGTVSEVVNGFFEKGQPLNPEAKLGIVTSGTGGDFSRSHPIPIKTSDQVRILGRRVTRPMDIGRVSFLDHAGKRAERYFANCASAGMSGVVCNRVNRARLSKKLGGRMAFRLAALHSLLGYRNQSVRLTPADAAGRDATINTVAICNGAYFGGGMQIAPDARPDDGRLDVVILGDFGLWDAAISMSLIYSGTHLEHPKVSSLRTRRIDIEPNQDSPVLIEVDGEAPGRLPASFEVLPGALHLVVGREEEGHGP